ncbi:hypothetical protein MSI_27500 [Treponema sp. JC4]|nr:hypothetical protein MSI_27500 [Treponema sp. JC4]
MINKLKSTIPHFIFTSHYSNTFKQHFLLVFPGQMRDFIFLQVHRLFTGDRLLIDDWTPTQFYAPLLYPLYTLFIKITGSTDGAFLFFRFLTLILQFFTSVFVFFYSFKKIMKKFLLFLYLSYRSYLQEHVLTDLPITQLG